MTWIDVKVKKPRQGKEVLVCNSRGTRRIAFRCDGSDTYLSLRARYIILEVTHWMELPEPPE